MRESPRVRLALLIILAAVPAGIEAAVVRGTGFTTTISLVPHITAVWPYGTFHDLLWVMVYHRSWAGFVGESLAAIGTRALLCTGLIALAWPPERERPQLSRLLLRNLGFSALLGAILSPWAALGVVASEVSVSWYLAGELIPLLIMAPVLQRGGIVPGWWRGLPPLGTVVLSLVNVVTLTAGSALMWWAPPRWIVPIAALVGGVNGILWRYAVRTALLHPGVRWKRVPVSPIVIVSVAVLVFVVADLTLLGGHGREQREPDPIAELEAASDGHPAIFLAGYDSDYTGEPSGRTLPVLRFSYRGLDRDGHPRPYPALATHQSLSTSATLLARQVEQVNRRTGRPVALLAESEGAFVAHFYLQTMPHPGVDRVAYLSPPIRAGRIYYPPQDRNAGWGIATGWELRAIFAILSATNGLPNSADEPFIRSLMDSAPLFRGNRLLCPERGVKTIAFLPTSDAITVSPSIHPRVPVVEVTAVHGILIDDPSARRRLSVFIESGRQEQRRVWGYAALQWAGAAWQAPSLRVPWNPAWRAVAGRSNQNFKPDECPAR
ncbi:hypothetical protein Raf01_65130 [Rugosimonospora africana]|uniref:Alpha/beta hydrolase n=2 Tax=Rugosimonospora africana TaxID=556532 RepID=A0A8J3VU40_9ACTN|nr:hypothetical protein Raf01_65130 [Rugosimonospora africana]